jgi:signal peptidase I
MTEPERASTRHREWMLVLVAAVVIAALLRAFVVQTFEVTSSSMEDTLVRGDRVVVEKVTHRLTSLRRGDLVVFDGSGSYLPRRERGSGAEGIRRLGATFGVGDATRDVFVKRIIGLPGDRVTCCGPDGSILLNGEALAEPYLRAGVRPSTTAFDVVLPSGRLWLLGDLRSQSSDSRAHLGDPGGGMVPVGKVIGRARLIVWPADRLGPIPPSPAEVPR